MLLGIITNNNNSENIAAIQTNKQQKCKERHPHSALSMWTRGLCGPDGCLSGCVVPLFTQHSQHLHNNWHNNLHNLLPLHNLKYLMSSSTTPLVPSPCKLCTTSSLVSPSRANSLLNTCHNHLQSKPLNHNLYNNHKQ